jgi:hypothetical protein
LIEIDDATAEVDSGCNFCSIFKGFLFVLVSPILLSVAIVFLVFLALFNLITAPFRCCCPRQCSQRGLHDSARSLDGIYRNKPFEDVGMKRFSVPISSTKFIPCSVFYPAAISPSRSYSEISWFRRGFVNYFMGYAHTLSTSLRKSCFLRGLARSLICCFKLLNPLVRATIPRCYEDAPVSVPAPNRPYPVIFFSHGLTGNNLVLCVITFNVSL